MHEKIQASSEWAGTWDWTNKIERSGSMPQASSRAPPPMTWRLSVAGIERQRHGVEIDEAVVGLIALLKRHPVLERSQQVAQMHVPGRLDAAEHPPFGLIPQVLVQT